MTQEAVSNPNDEIVNRMVLDIKALMLLNASEEDVRRLMNEKFLSLHDEHVTRFLSVLQPKKRASNKGNLLIAMAELVLASFLVIAGLSILTPSIVGFTSPQQLLNYFIELVTSISVSSLSNPLIPPLELALAIILLIGAFYTIRLAAASLKEIGSLFESPLAPKSSES